MHCWTDIKAAILYNSGLIFSNSALHIDFSQLPTTMHPNKRSVDFFGEFVQLHLHLIHVVTKICPFGCTYALKISLTFRGSQVSSQLDNLSVAFVGRMTPAGQYPSRRRKARNWEAMAVRWSTISSMQFGLYFRHWLNVACCFHVSMFAWCLNRF